MVVHVCERLRERLNEAQAPPSTSLRNPGIVSEGKGLWMGLWSESPEDPLCVWTLLVDISVQQECTPEGLLGCGGEEGNSGKAVMQTVAPILPTIVPSWVLLLTGPHKSWALCACMSCTGGKGTVFQVKEGLS
jgi:hypothetical protein